jgi:hypothetical protein
MKNSKGFVAIAQNFNIKSKKVKRLREGLDLGSRKMFFDQG